jgi:hypothetical protein
MFIVDVSAPSHYTLLGVASTATAAEIRVARDARILELRKAERQEPHRRAEFAEQQREINAAAEVLLRAAQRLEYDEEHPDLRLFTVRTAAAALFTEPADRTGVLYRALAAHLAARGSPAEPPSDLHRTDFSIDATPNHLLDELIAKRRR